MRQVSLWELLHAGDWACAQADDEALARVAVALARIIEPALASAALGVAVWTRRDMHEASLRWGMLSDELRASAEVRG